MAHQAKADLLWDITTRQKGFDEYLDSKLAIAHYEIYFFYCKHFPANGVKKFILQFLKKTEVSGEFHVRRLVKKEGSRALLLLSLLQYYKTVFLRTLASQLH